MNQTFYLANGKKIGVFLRDEADQSVAAEIFKLKEYRRADQKIRGAKSPILDVGAHSGLFVLYARALNSKVEIFAIEPELKNLALLQKHLVENKISRVKVIPGVLAGETGERTLKISADSHNHRLSATPPAPSWKEGDNSEEKYQTVKAFSLSDFLKNNKIKKVSLLKMDIEGAEYEVLFGLKAEDWLKVEAIILEYHPAFAKATARQSDLGPRKLEMLLRENGFGVEVFPSKFDKNLGFIFAQNKRIR